MGVLDLMENTRDIAQTTPDLSALPVTDAERWASALGAIGGNLASPHGVLIIAAIVFGIAFWLHKRRGPARELSRHDLEDYQG
jgi:hypothetical protein